MKMAMFVMLVWGNVAFAALPNSQAELSDISEDRQTISSWTAHLNKYYPALAVRVRVNLDHQKQVTDTLSDLEKLENELQGEASYPANSLINIACSKIICGKQ